MPASLLTLPPELREQILFPVVQARGTIELQYPLWADKTVFVPAVMQVCKVLREDATQVFYRANVFCWMLDPEAVRPWGASIDPVDPTTFPLQRSQCGEKEYGPSGPLVSSLPWQNPNMLANLRHLRLNLYVPPQHDASMWTNKFAKQLSDFVKAVDRGQKLRDLRVLVGTWHKIHELTESQKAILGILETMQVRGVVQVRTRSLDLKGKAVVQSLDLERHMKGYGSASSKGLEAGRLGVRHLDWEWEGGAKV